MSRDADARAQVHLMVNSLICKAPSNSNESGWCESSVEYGHDSVRPCEGSRETGLE